VICISKMKDLFYCILCGVLPAVISVITSLITNVQCASYSLLLR